MVSAMDALPTDALLQIFQYLDPGTNLGVARRVNREWHQWAGQGCVFFRLEQKRASVSGSAGNDDAFATVDDLEVVGHSRSLSSSCSSKDMNMHPGIRASQNHSLVGDGVGDGENSHGKSPWLNSESQRTCGRLPRPKILANETASTSSTIIPAQRIVSVSAPSFLGVVCCMEQHEPQTFHRSDNNPKRSKIVSNQKQSHSFLCSMNISSARSSFRLNTNNLPYSSRCGPSRKKSLCGSIMEMDLSTLRHLVSLSVRMCNHLKILRVPLCLMELDAAAASNLECILLPISYSISKSDCRNGVNDNSRKTLLSLNEYSNRANSLNGRFDSSPIVCGNFQWKGFDVLNLDGCRSLSPNNINVNDTKNPSTSISNGTTHPCNIFNINNPLITPNTLSQTRILDVTNNRSIPPKYLSEYISHCRSLVSLSLRYIATNEILSSVASCNAASTVLAFVDVAFSMELTDEPVRALVDAAKRLEKINLRGCRRISASCYNEVSLLLASRQHCLPDNDNNMNYKSACDNNDGIPTSTFCSGAEKQEGRGKIKSLFSKQSRKGDAIFALLDRSHKQYK